MKSNHTLVLLLALLAAQTAGANTLTVTSTADSGPGTLRAALASAADGDTIDVTGVSGTILLTSGELLVSNSVDILGPGPDGLFVNGNATDRIFYVSTNAVVHISGLTITNGLSSEERFTYGSGGGIYTLGILTVSNCVLSGNTASNNDYPAYGGGICNGGALTVVNSTIRDNFADPWGGGIENYGGLMVSNCTISGNSANYLGGGINNGLTGSSATLTIANSTLSGNRANYRGGGIYNDGVYVGSSATLTITNSTFSGNSAYNNGGSIWNGYATLEIGSTILNAGASGGNIYNEATVTSLGYNLSSDDGSGLLTAMGDQINTDPMLGPLQDNGGPTFTHALLPGSPCINAGDPAFVGPPDFDQRGPGYPRVVGGRIDIGAFECEPWLGIARNFGNLVLSWSTNFPGFTLEYTTFLPNSGSWTPVPGTRLVIGDQYLLGDGPVSGNRFYRLRSP